MTPLGDAICDALGKKVAERAIVVWYDPRREFASFVDQSVSNGEIEVGKKQVPLIRFAGSMIEVRTAAEVFLSTDEPQHPGRVEHVHVAGHWRSAAVHQGLDAEIPFQRDGPGRR